MRRAKIALALVIFVLGCALVPQALADEENVVDTQQLPDSSFIYDVSIQDLSTADVYYNKQTVQVEGEVVGDKISAQKLNGNSVGAALTGADGSGEGAEGESYCWITLVSKHPETNASVMVYMKEKDAQKIIHFGSYSEKGTTLRVQGTYNLACPDHEGLSDVHADKVVVIDAGSDTSAPFELEDFLPGTLAVMAGLVLLVVFYVLKERRR